MEMAVVGGSADCWWWCWLCSWVLPVQTTMRG